MMIDLENFNEQIKNEFLKTVSGGRRPHAVLIDGGTEEEREEDGYAEGFNLCIPVDELRERIAEVPTGKPVYVMCYSGVRSYIACSILAQKGFDCYNFSGGYRFYDIVKELI